jgi:hypothetical protein
MLQSEKLNAILLIMTDFSLMMVFQLQKLHSNEINGDPAMNGGHVRTCP